MVTPPALRIVFFGTPAFAVPTLDALLASRHVLAGVVTQPDRPRGRGQQTSDAPVKARAAAAGLPVVQPVRLADAAFLEALGAFRPDLGVVAAYGRILSDAVLAVPRLGMVNVHASLLPRYRGAAPVHRAVMAGERETGVTIMRVVRELDAGPMLATVVRPIGPDETSDEVERELAAAGAALLVATVDRMATGPVEEIPQDHATATYAPRITRGDGVIDWSRTAGAIHDQIRGLYPWPHAFSYLDGRRIIFLRARALDEPSSLAPGTVVGAKAERLLVATGGGLLDVVLLQAEGRRAMSPRDFLAGHAIRLGARFTSSP
jgi:methionyl-tRNA formyltransferase